MLIPRVMNFYWGGGNLSYLQYLTVFSFNKFNPLWKIVLHTPTVISNEITWVTDEQKAQYFGPNYLDELKSLHYVNVNIVDFEEIGFLIMSQRFLNPIIFDGIYYQHKVVVGPIWIFFMLNR